MGSIYLCIGDYAKTPYEIYEAGISIHSVEELCYYLVENIHILDSGICNQELIDWLKNECHLEELSEILKKCLKETDRASQFVMEVLNYTHYVDHNKVQEIGHILDKSSSMSGQQKRKLRADYCFRSGHYDKAFAMYQMLLMELNKDNIEMAAKIYHNIGTIFSIKYDFRKAADAYLEAYQMSGSIESRRSYIMAMQLYLPEDEYKVFCSDRQDWEEDIKWAEITLYHMKEKWEKSEGYSRLQNMILDKKKSDKEYYYNLEQYIEQRKAAYRKQFD